MVNLTCEYRKTFVWRNWLLFRMCIISLTITIVSFLTVHQVERYGAWNCLVKRRLQVACSYFKVLQKISSWIWFDCNWEHSSSNLFRKNANTNDCKIFPQKSRRIPCSSSRKLCEVSARRVRRTKMAKRKSWRKCSNQPMVLHSR